MLRFELAFDALHSTVYLPEREGLGQRHLGLSLRHDGELGEAILVLNDEERLPRSKQFLSLLAVRVLLLVLKFVVGLLVHALEDDSFVAPGVEGRLEHRILEHPVNEA